MSLLLKLLSIYETLKSFASRNPELVPKAEPEGAWTSRDVAVANRASHVPDNQKVKPKAP